MAVRNIVQIDEKKCNGCGQCVINCAEGALKIIDGKARLISETYCDGLGACLGHCPQDAITIIQRESAEFDEKAVEARLAAPLQNWPVQLKLISPNAEYFAGKDIVIAADCTAFAYGNFHAEFLGVGVQNFEPLLIIACPKLDNAAQMYVEKLAELFKTAKPKSVTIVRMEVPCCSGLTKIVEEAKALSGMDVVVEEMIIGVNGSLMTNDKTQNPNESPIINH